MVLDLVASGPSGETVLSARGIDAVAERLGAADLVTLSRADAELVTGGEIASLDDAQVAAQRDPQPRRPRRRDPLRVDAVPLLRRRRRPGRSRPTGRSGPTCTTTATTSRSTRPRSWTPSRTAPASAVRARRAGGPDRRAVRPRTRSSTPNASPPTPSAAPSPWTARAPGSASRSTAPPRPPETNGVRQRRAASPAPRPMPDSRPPVPARRSTTSPTRPASPSRPCHESSTAPARSPRPPGAVSRRRSARCSSSPSATPGRSRSSRRRRWPSPCRPLHLCFSLRC